MEEREHLLELLNKPGWPLAIPAYCLCDFDSRQDRHNRAQLILDEVVGVSLRGRSFLDFGCGDGFTVMEAHARGARVAVGFDPLVPTTGAHIWDENESDFILTNSLARLRQESPYDVILIHDVLDHCTHDLQVLDLLRIVQELGHSGSLIFIRCHPWSSRHGGHSYRQMNRAFAHLILRDSEWPGTNTLESHILRTTNPYYYRRFFGLWLGTLGSSTQRSQDKDRLTLRDLVDISKGLYLSARQQGALRWPRYSGIRTLTERVTRNPVEPIILSDGLVQARVREALALPDVSDENLREILSISFVDYELKVI